MNFTLTQQLETLLAEDGSVAGRITNALERLFNTRCLADLDAEDPLAASLAGYGMPKSLPDLAKDEQGQEDFRRRLEFKLAAFVPALRNARVRIGHREGPRVWLEIQGEANATAYTATAVINENGHITLGPAPCL